MNGRVAIIGAGVIGLVTALECVRRGWRVTVVERNGVVRDGCSYGNAGIVVPSHFVPLAAPGMVALALKWMWKPGSPFYVKPRASWRLLDWAIRFWRAANPRHVERAAPVLRDLARASSHGYETLAAEANDFGFSTGGTLMLCRTRHALEEEARTAEHAARLGVSAEVLDAAGTAAREPGVRADIAGSVYYPTDCRLVPAALMASLQRRAEHAGVRFEWNTAIRGFRMENGRIRAAVATRGGDIEADQYVLCAGAWSADLARGIGLTLPLQAGKGYSLTLEHPRVALRHSAILTEARASVTPMGKALRIGGTMALAGLDERIDPARVRGIIEAVPRYYADLVETDLESIQPWRGLRPCSPDGLPYVGRTARCANVVIATGHAMMGVTLAPITGRLVAGMLSSEPTGHDLAMLSPDRFRSFI